MQRLADILLPDQGSVLIQLHAPRVRDREKRRDLNSHREKIIGEHGSLAVPLTDNEANTPAVADHSGPDVLYTINDAEVEHTGPRDSLVQKHCDHQRESSTDWLAEAKLTKVSRAPFAERACNLQQRFHTAPWSDQ